MKKPSFPSEHSAAPTGLSVAIGSARPPYDDMVHRRDELKSFGIPQPDFADFAALRWIYAQLHDPSDWPKTVREHARIIREELAKQSLPNTKDETRAAAPF